MIVIGFMYNDLYLISSFVLYICNVIFLIYTVALVLYNLEIFYEEHRFIANEGRCFSFVKY